MHSDVQYSSSLLVYYTWKETLLGVKKRLGEYICT